MSTQLQKNKKKIITICSSASFYKEVAEIEKKLKALGFAVKIPKTAATMKRTGDFTVKKTWFQNKADYKIKKQLIDSHFKKILASDAILVVNLEKNGMQGYIGGNVLMEMVIAYYFKKPIYVWNPIDSSLPFEEEVLGIGSIFINQDLSKIPQT